MLDSSNSALSLSILALAALGFVLFYYRTVLLGFTFFSFLNIVGGSLSGFLFASLFQLDTYWVSSAHLWVVTYSALGLIAFTIGVFLAWRPLKSEVNFHGRIVYLQWHNQRFALLCLTTGIIAYQLSPFTNSIPTLGAIWSGYLILLKVGVLIALVYSRSTATYRTFIYIFIIFEAVVVVQAVLSGHIGAGGSFLLQLLLVGCFWYGLNVRSLLFFLVGMLLVSSLLVGWLGSRGIIREGVLEGTTTARSLDFLQQFKFTNPTELDPNIVQEAIRTRVDMTDILARQAAYQPAIKSYAYGKTIFPNLFYALIPRFLWASKPVSLGGSEFVSEFTGLFWRIGTSVGLQYPFELYANGGALTVIVGLFVIGWLTAKLELFLFTKQFSLPQFLGLLFLTTSLANGSQTIVALIMAMIPGYIGMYLLGKLLERWNHKWHFWGNMQPIEINRLSSTVKPIIRSRFPIST